MALINVKKYKVAKKLGSGLYEKTQGQKFMLAQAKGDKKKKRGKRQSDYGKQLMEKQKVRYMYGLNEKQFANYVKKAMSHSGDTTPALKLFQLLEQRLDNVVYRLGLADTRGMARQLSSHGHFTVNGRKATIPSYHVKEGDEVSIKESSKTKPVFAEIGQKLKGVTPPGWISRTDKEAKGSVSGTPNEPEPFLDFQAVVEFYSR